MKSIINNFKQYLPLLTQMIIRNLKVRYRKSILGVFWTLLSPLLMMVVLSVVFSNIFKFNVTNYPVYILTGQVIFNFFSEATNESMMSILSNAPLIKKIYVPKYIFPFSAILSSLINVMASFAALIIVMLFMRMELHFTILLSFIPILILMIMATGCGLILSALVVKFRDVVHFYGVFLTALMYLMPVIYPMNILDNVPIVREIVAYNPLTILLNTFRDLSMNGVFPQLEIFILLFLISIALFGCGLLIFYKRQDTFIMDI